MKWGIERRLAFIEFRLQWDGRINRSDVVDVFGISPNQATKDLVQYSELVPDNIRYDKRTRAYVRGGKFSPRFTPSGSDQYLSQLRSVADGVLPASEAWIGRFPEFDVVAMPIRNVDQEILRSVAGAIHERLDLELEYQSLSNPEPSWRWVGPRAICFDGFRWHVRAFCHRDRSFKDFLFSRITTLGKSRPSGADGEDVDWANRVDLVIAPHPSLSEKQKAVVEMDYGMTDGRVTITMRKALLHYALRRLGLDTDPSARPPHEQQIVLLDREAILRLRDGDR